MFIKGTLFYLFLTLILSICFLYSKAIVLLILIELVFIYVFVRVDYKLAILLCIAFIFMMFYKVNVIPSVDETFVSLQAKVIEVKEKYIIANSENINYLVYINEDITLYKNDSIQIIGEVSLIEKDLDIDVFEFADYLKNKRVFYQIDYKQIELINHNFTISSKTTNYLTQNLTEESYAMCKMLLFNDKYADIDNYESLKKINAIHLFVVSGFHITFLFSIIEKVFRKTSKLSVIMGIFVCFSYLFILDFSISATRAVISLTLLKLFSKYLNSLDCMSIAGIILLLIEPLNVYSYSFIMSFMMTFIIIISNKIYCKYNKIKQSLIISLISFISMIPIQLILNYEINFISLLSNFVLSYIVAGIFVLCFFSIVFSFINGNIFGVVYRIFNEVISLISSLETTILFGNMPILATIIYYILFFLTLIFIERKRLKASLLSSGLLFMCLLLLYGRHYINPFQRVTFLNVYQGDCTIIQDSFSDNVMLVDTGGLLNYDIASKKIIPYLRYHGIKDIDIIVITHDDFDHNGALNSLCSLYNVKQVITDNSIQTVTLGKLTFNNINTINNDSTDENDGSIVLYGQIGGLNFLFTGDISSKIEHELITYYSDLDVDILKVAHHGSKTSTSDSFVNFINCDYAIISVGENNFYGHPNKEVLNTLDKHNVTVYRTDINGTIRFNIKNKIFYFIETAK